MIEIRMQLLSRIHEIQSHISASATCIRNIHSIIFLHVVYNTFRYENLISSSIFNLLKKTLIG